MTLGGSASRDLSRSKSPGEIGSQGHGLFFYRHQLHAISAETCAKRLAKRGFPQRYGRVSRRPAEAVEEDEQEHRDKGVDERAREEAQTEPGFGLRKKDAARQSHDRLMNDEKP